ncbi:universal stress protein [Natrinema sp. 1APR25-10V2]|uniref:universal stress protein n=1 Tax=Natrinema sp. 1APR25-10V2 TaxID=2951081 RepID=UPI0028765931|nr:universal stress protein [Natrinema sp. 1APR25-10V2]MDS0474440.1 universal stress protein [Natrinema sp. 1APR25-10V2]
MFDRLLVPTDGSGPATAAIELAAKVASPSATVHLLYVAETERDTDGTDDVPAGASERGEEILETADELVNAAGASVVSEIRHGVPREQILEYAAAHDIEAIAMGSHGRRRTGRLALGRETRNVVRDAPIPVFVVRASDDVRRVFPFERVLVPTDGSAHANAALERGVETAAETGATLHLLTVVSATRYGADDETDRLIGRLEENARAALEAPAEKAAEAGLEVRTAVSVGTVHREIAAYAESEDADLLVMGTHGRSDAGSERELLGSVTERVLQTAPSPVLTVRASETTDGTVE